MSDYAAVAGASGIAFDAAGALHTNADGGLAYVGTRLYAVSRTAGEVRELDATGATLRVVSSPATLPCPEGLAGWGSDLYVTSCAGIKRIRDVGGAAVMEWFSNPGQSAIATHAITISPDGIVFATAGANVWQVGRVTDATPTLGAVLTNVPSAAGIVALSPPGASGTPLFRFLFIARSDGVVEVFDKNGVIPRHAIVAAGSGGDHSVIGPDGCLYVPQTAAVARVANANGTCDLAAAVTTRATVTLSSDAVRPRVNATAVTLSAALTGAPAGTAVRFTMSGANAQTSPVVPMDPVTRRAVWTYTGTVAGRDTVSASAVIGGTTVTSSSLTIDWLPPLDTTPPDISFVVSGSGALARCPAAPSPSDPLAVYCGWYDSPPTVTWSYADPQSGIGAATGCEPFTLVASSPATGTPVTCTVTNGDGLSTHRTVILQALLEGPAISAAATAAGAPYAAGTLVAAPVTLTFTCTHPAGAFAVPSCPAPQTVAAGDGTLVQASAAVTDLAGHTASASFGPVRVDTTAPLTSATVSGTPATGGAIVAPATVTLSATDAGFGVASITYTVDGGAPTTTAASSIAVVLDRPGTHTVIFSARDRGGNVEVQRSVTVRVVRAAAPGCDEDADQGQQHRGDERPGRDGGADRRRDQEHTCERQHGRATSSRHAQRTSVD